MSINKPDWNDAPDWANYVAMDEDGEWWWWYEHEPDLKEDCWDSGGRSTFTIPDSKGWEDTLEKRP